MQVPTSSNLDLDILSLAAAAIIIVFGTLIAFASRYKKCPSDRILVAYLGKLQLEAQRQQAATKGSSDLQPPDRRKNARRRKKPTGKFR